MPRYSSQGTKFYFEVTDGAALVEMTGLSDINLNEAGKSEVDATGLDDATSVTLDGLAQASTLSVSLFYDPNLSAHETLRTLAASANVVRDFEIRFTQASPGRKLSGSGIVTKATPTIGRNNALLLTCELKLTTSLAIGNIA